MKNISMLQYKYWYPVDKQSVLVQIIISVIKQQGIMMDQF